MKVLAMYLPQYHRIPENDLWWGEGFTEWTAVKKAEKLYEEHDQPKIPQHENYYDLLDKNTMKWQSELMKKYDVDGMCIYHYWFKEGRQILEKPAENLLRWEDIDMPFCFCWANETWARSWSNLQDKNSWAVLYEPGFNKASRGILLEQDYGDEIQWEEHFAYLLPFFKDKRYIKVNGKPLFLIYKAAEISRLGEMLECWQSLAQSHGLDGLYIVGKGRNAAGKDYCIDAQLFYQPSRSSSDISVPFTQKQNGIAAWEYDDIWKKILEEEPLEKTFFQGVVGYDDTPRRGCMGMIIENGSPEKFSNYLTELMAKSAACGNDVIFLNAWNEWGEGMYLEPDEKHGDAYLRAIPFAKEHYRDRIEAYNKPSGKIAYYKRARSICGFTDKNLFYLHLLDKWMRLRENRCSVAEYLSVRNYGSVAIYGYGLLGKHLYKELIDSDINIKYLIDRQGEQLNINVKVYLPSEIMPKVDAVLVSAVYDYDEIYRLLRDKKIGKILSLETILSELDTIL